jgi:hypothetical protein
VVGLTTKNSIEISWQEPNTNGCPLTSFDILRDTGNSDPLTITVDPAIVGNKPSLREYVVNGLNNVGSVYRFKIRAYNAAG